jgi:hypothetical protein
VAEADVRLGGLRPKLCVFGCLARRFCREHTYSTRIRLLLGTAKQSFVNYDKVDVHLAPLL